MFVFSSLFVWLCSVCASWFDRVAPGLGPLAAGASASASASEPDGGSRWGEHGQTTAEYALVLIGAAALAFLLISWASKSDAIGNLFNFVIEHVTGSVK